MAEPQHRRFAVMGTEAHVLVLGPAEWALDRAQHRLAELERRWSRFLSDSELSRLNRAAGVPVIVSPETFGLIEAAIEGWRWSGGGFDPTVGLTMRAAGYDRPFSEMDRSGRRRSTHLPAPGPEAVILHPDISAVELPAGVELDLGGIAKGAAADLVADELLAGGVEGCCINIGGDLRAAGSAPRAEGWQVTLDCPGATSVLAIGLGAGAVCTTTKTRRRWPAATTVEHHLRQPRTGAPLETGIASVTVISARGLQAEILTKAVFAAGLERGVTMLAEAEATGLVVLDDGTVMPMPGLDPFAAAALGRETA